MRLAAPEIRQVRMKRENRNKREGLESGVEGFPVLLLHPHRPQRPHRGRSLACWRQGARGWRVCPPSFPQTLAGNPSSILFLFSPTESVRIYLPSSHAFSAVVPPYQLLSPGFLFPDVSLSPPYIISSLSYVNTKICHINPRGHTASNMGQGRSPGPGSRW